jgi:speckle-type POZ protein
LALYENVPQENYDPEHPTAKVYRQCFFSEAFSDITLVSSDGEQFHGHRCILAARSEAVKQMLTSVAALNKVELCDIDGETMYELLRYIYTNQVEDLDKLAPKLIYAAEKFDITELKSMCAMQLMVQITADNIFEILVLADVYDEKELLRECLDYMVK